MPGFFAHFHETFLRPSERVFDEEERSRTTLLSGLLLIYLISILGFMGLAFFHPNLIQMKHGSWIGWGLDALATCIAYGLSRTRHHRVAPFFFIAAQWLSIAFMVATSREASVIQSTLPWLLIGTLISSLTLPMKAIQQVAAAHMALFILATPFIPGSARGALVSGLLFHLTGTALTLIGTSLRLEAQTRLKRNEQKLRNTFEQAAVGIAHLSFDGKVLWGNPSFCDLFGYTDEEIQAKCMRELTVADEKQEEDELSMQDLLNDEILTYYADKQLLRKGGGIVWASLSSRLMRDEFGNPLYFVAVFQDISDRKQAESLLELERARSASSSRLSALGEMSGGIAHEINNPLAIIHGRAAMLIELAEAGFVDPQDVVQASKKIVGTAERIARIVKSLRAFARDGERDPFDLAPVQTIVDDTMELCRERFRVHSIDLIVEGVPTSAVLECRSVQVSQVLLNLLNNAFDAAEKQTEKWVKLEIEELPDAIQFSVTDSGGGIPEEHRSRIMQPFFTTKDVGKGTGLGLSVSTGIVNAHHGTLRLDTDSPRTRFVVTIPKEHARPSASPNSSGDVSEAA